MSARFFYFFAFVTFMSCGIPDYWKDRTYTTNNGTQHTPVPFTIEAKNTEYNEKNSPRDTFLRTSLMNFTHIDLWDKTNEPPVNRSGTVSIYDIHDVMFFYGSNQNSSGGCFATSFIV